MKGRTVNLNFCRGKPTLIGFAILVSSTAFGQKIEIRRGEFAYKQEDNKVFFYDDQILIHQQEFPSKLGAKICESFIQRRFLPQLNLKGDDYLVLDTEKHCTESEFLSAKNA